MNYSEEQQYTHTLTQYLTHYVSANSPLERKGKTSQMVNNY